MSIVINGMTATRTDLIALWQNLKKGKDRILNARMWKGTLFIETV